MTQRYEFPCCKLGDGTHVHSVTFIDPDADTLGVMAEIVAPDGSSERFVSTLPPEAKHDTALAAKLCFAYGFRVAQSEGHELTGVSISVDPSDPLHHMADAALKAVQSLEGKIEVYRPVTATVH